MELLKKLRINADKPLWLINMPYNPGDIFTNLVVKEKLSREKPIGQIILFAVDSKTLAYELPRLTDYIAHETLFWICYPKKSGSLTSDLILMKSWDIVIQSGYRGQTSVSFDDDWTAMRFTNAPRKKPSDCDKPMAERKAEGIDYVNRTVQLPDDALAAVNNYKGMDAFFNSLSFTCKKEYVTAIADAKKADTRKRRIEKTVEMLLQKMNAKSGLR